MKKPRNKTPGMDLEMASIGVPLGRYVVIRPCRTQPPRKDGTRDVRFEVPGRLRPSGWLPTIPLPIHGRRSGNLNDLDEVARIQRDAADLYAQLMAARQQRQAPRSSRTIDTLIANWQASQAWKDNKERTNRGYGESLKLIRRWSAAHGDPDPTLVTVEGIETMLAAFDDRPTTRYHVRKVLRMVMKQAVRLKWRPDNPVDEVNVAMPKSRVAIWEQADVDLYAWAACLAGQPEVAAIILTEWEIGQRLTDVILLRRGAEYIAAEGIFQFEQSKTAEPVSIPISDRLRAMLEAIKRDGSLYLFHDAKTGRPFPDVGRLGHIFDDVRNRLVLPAGGRRLVLRALRHSCVVQLARADCKVAEIASITGHSLASAHTVLKNYLPRDSKVARGAQEKRGLIGRST